VRIATFNLENLSDGSNTTTTLDDRCRILRPQLNRLAADILCVQEVGAEHEGTKSTPRQFRALSALLTLSRFPIARFHQLWNDLVPPPRYKLQTAEPEKAGPEIISWDRPILHTEVKLGNGRLLHVFNLHLRAPLSSYIPGQKIGQFKWRTVSGWAEGFFVAAIKRSGQALEVRFAIDSLFDAEPNALVVICGDMNAEEQEMPLRILRGDDMETENPALAPRMMIPMEKAAPDARRYSVIHGGRPVMLDHMLVSRALFDRFQKIEIHNEDLKDELTDYQRGENLSVSHHAPIVATFDLKDTDNAPG